MEQLKSGFKTFQLFIHNFQHHIKLILIEQDNIYIYIYIYIYISIYIKIKKLSEGVMKQENIFGFF